MALFRSIWDDFRYSLRAGNMVTKLVVINFAIFVLANLAFVAVWMVLLGGDVSAYFWEGINYLCISADWKEILWRPWTIFTHFFLHVDVLHFINNIFGLYLFGTIVHDLIGNQRVLPLYLLGGLAGALFFWVSSNFSPFFGQYALGASAAVMAMSGAALILAPDYRVPLFLLGEVKVKYIVLVFVLLDIVGVVGRSTNAGGHVAHIGGFIMGCFFVYRLRDGHDLSKPVNRAIDWISDLFRFSNKRQTKPILKSGSKSAIKVAMTPAKGSNKSDSNVSQQEKLDQILEKIKANGYENLSQEEKDFLYEASKK